MSLKFVYPGLRYCPAAISVGRIFSKGSIVVIFYFTNSKFTEKHICTEKLKENIKFQNPGGRKPPNGVQRYVMVSDALRVIVK